LFIKKQKRIKRVRSLKLFQNVSTRWNFTCHIFIRAHDLRSKITQFCIEYEVFYLLFNSNEWSQIEYLIDLLKSFCLFTKALSTIRTSTINMIFKIYNRLFEHIEKITHRLSRKRVSWKKSLMKTLEATRIKLIKYYNQTQSELDLLYDKAILLHSTVEESMFHTSEWKIESDQTSWHKMYWNALKEMYHEDKYQTNENSSFHAKQFSENSSRTLDDILNDEKTIQIFSNENEFISYQRQDIIEFVLIFILILLLTTVFSIFCSFQRKISFKAMKYSRVSLSHYDSHRKRCNECNFVRRR
jgi:hypothetical protein